MRYRSPRHRAAPPSPSVTPSPSPDGVPDTVPSIHGSPLDPVLDHVVLDHPVPGHVVRVVFTLDIAALDQRAA